VRREVLAIDLAVAVILAALVLILSPGVAVAGMIALIVLLVCVFSVVWDIRRRRRRPGTRRTGSRRTESRRAAPRQSRPRRDR
jgi:Flp pilus assembly protein TadB